jgi:hypothetical protein
MRCEIDVTPSLPKTLLKAYLEAEYEVHTSPPFVLHVDRADALLVRLMEGRGVQTAALVTAFNPFSQQLTESQNSERSEHLEGWLVDRCLVWLPASGTDPMRRWSPEPSYLVLGADQKVAEEAMRKFEQHAVVFVDQDCIPRLLLHPGHRKVRAHPQCGDRSQGKGSNR